MKICFCEGVKELKDELYARFKEQTKKDLSEFERVRKPFYDTWTPEDGFFGDCHYKVVVPALNKYEAAINAPYEEYQCLYEAVEVLYKHKIDTSNMTRAEILVLLKEEAKKIKVAKELMEKQIKK